MVSRRFLSVLSAVTFAGINGALIPTAVSAAQTSGGADPGIGRALGLSAWRVQHVNLPAGAGESFTMTAHLDGVAREITFDACSVRAPGFRVVVQDASGALRPIDAPPENTYRGHVAGVPGAVVSGAITRAGLSAMIRLPAGTWCVDPLRKADPAAPAASHVVYRAQDVAPHAIRCGTTPADALASAIGARSTSGAGAPDTARVCEIACDADSTFYQLSGSSTNTVVEDVSSIINGVSAIYESDAQIAMAITEIVIRISAASDPYGSTSGLSPLLSAFVGHWNTHHAGVHRDVGHLFTNRGEAYLGGIAYLSSVCNEQAYGISRSFISLNFEERVAITAHELGHNLGALHCNEAPWACAPCNFMCSTLNGCGGNLTELGCSRDAILAFAATRPCLEPPPVPALSIAFHTPPAVIRPGVSTDLDVHVIPGSQQIAPGSATLHYRFAPGLFSATPLLAQGGNLFRGRIVAGGCADAPEYYFTATGDLGAQVSLPAAAPGAVFAVPVGTPSQLTTVLSGFEGGLPAGWTATGLWHVASSLTCVGFECDGDANAAHYARTDVCTINTGAGHSGDLVSAPIDLPVVGAGGSLILRYCSEMEAFSVLFGMAHAEVLVNGQVVDTPGHSPGTWETRTADLTPFAGQTVTVRFRFTMTMPPPFDEHGWYVDNVSLTRTGAACSECYADCGGDGVLTVADFGCFQNRFSVGDPYADCNADGQLTVSDFGCFQSRFVAGCP